MPILSRSSYPGPPRYQTNGHWQTIVPSLRRIPAPYERERFTLPDGDFLDVDWLAAKSRKLVILTHGLEGNSRRPYVAAMARYFWRAGWNVLAWNCRSCSGEMNLAPRLYHHGEIEDISYLIERAMRTKDFTHIGLIGFSMGGNITGKYLGSRGSAVPDVVVGGVAFSSPYDLASSVAALELPGNNLYKKRFMQALTTKMRLKAEQHPGLLPSMERLKEVGVWRDFDELFSAPLNGFASAAEFYQAASAKYFLAELARPLLLVNADNDPLLLPPCSPVEIAERNPFFYLERPREGGHVGFSLPWQRRSWMESRAWEFLAEGKK